MHFSRWWKLVHIVLAILVTRIPHVSCYSKVLPFVLIPLAILLIFHGIDQGSDSGVNSLEHLFRHPKFYNLVLPNAEIH